MPQEFSSLKTLFILEAMAQTEGDGYIGILDICRMTGYTQGTVHRIINEMTQAGYVEKNAQIRKYKMGIQSVILASRFMHSNSIVAAARNEMLKLGKETGETIHLLSIVGNEVIYLHKVDTPHSVGLMSSVGKRNPIHCTSGGKAIAAFRDSDWLENYLKTTALERFTDTTITSEMGFRSELRKIAELGYATDNGEHHENIICIGAPIFDRQGAPIASISIAAPLFRFPIETALTYAGDVKQSAKSISMMIGGSG